MTVPPSSDPTDPSPMPMGEEESQDPPRSPVPATETSATGRDRRGFFASSSVLLLGQATNFFSGLGRNVIVAREIGKADWGTAAVFSLFVTGLEQMSDVGLDKQIVQSRHAKDPKFQHVLQAAAVARGVLLAALVLGSASWVANLIDTPDAAWAFCVLAAVPLIRGFGHLDVVRFQREKRFLPWVITLSVPQVVTLAMAYPLASWIQSYAAVLYLVITQTVLTVLLGQWLSKRPYRIGWSGEYFRAILKFGWPLTLSGGLMLIVLQGDRLLVGAKFTTEVLADFQAAFILAMAPTALLASPIRSYILPILSRQQSDNAAFSETYEISVQLAATLALVVACGLTCFAPALILVLFKEGYRDAFPFVPWLALMWSIRLMRDAPNTAAIGRSLTKIPLLTNVLRASALFVSYLLLTQGFPAYSVVVVAGIAEGVALLLGMTLLASQVPGAPRAWNPAVLSCSAGMAVVITLSWNQGYDVSFGQGVLWFLCILGAAAILLPWTTHRKLFSEAKILTRRH